MTTERMNFWQHIGSWLLSRKSPALEIIGQQTDGSAYLDVRNSQPAPGRRSLIDSYRGTSFACANLCAQGVAATPLRLYVTTGPKQAKPKCGTRGISSKRLQMLSGKASIAQKVVAAEDVEEVTDHPLVDLLHAVNSELDGYTLLELTDLYMETVGSAYWWLPRNALGVIDTIWILQAQFMAPEYKKGVLVGYEYGTGKAKKHYRVDEILPFHMPNLTNPYYEGLSPLRAAFEAVHLEEQGRAFYQNLMENQARPDIIISPKGDGGMSIGDDEARRLERRFMRKYKRSGTNRAMVVSDEIDVKTLTIPPKDAEAALMHGLTKEDIANAFGVPMSLLQTKDVNRANAEAGHYQLARNAILPRCRRLEQRLTQRFAALFDPRLFLAFDDPVPESRELAMQERTAMLANGVISINEGRQELGREPIPDGDVHLVPMSQVPLGSEPPEPPPTPEPPDEEPDDEPGDGKRVKLFDVLAAHACREMDTSSALVELHKLGVEPNHALDALDLPQLPVPHVCCTDKNEPPFVDEWDVMEKFEGVTPWNVPELIQKAQARSGHNRQFPKGTRLRDEMKAIFREQKKDTLRHFKNVLTAMGKALPLDDSIVFDADAWTTRMQGRVAPIWGTTMEAGITDAAKRLSVRVGEQVPVISRESMKVLEVIDKRTLQFCAETNATTSMQIDVALAKTRQEIAEGLLTGDASLPAMTKRINAIFDGAESYRAERIARTETSNAIHQGQMLEAQESGVVKGFRPLLSADACEICVDYAATHKIIGLYDDGNLPPWHPNCMCTVTEVLIDE